MSHLFTSTRHQVDLFSPFFDSGMEESISPFLIPSSRKWSHHLRLKAAFLAGICLVLGYGLRVCSAWAWLAPLPLLFTYFLAGMPSLIGALDDLTHGDINIDILMVLAAFFSVVIGSAYEGGLLLVLFAISNAMEYFVSGRAKTTLNALQTLVPSKAHLVLADGSLMDVRLEDVSIGSHVWVKAGEVVPLDGVILRGQASVHLAHLTGESLPLSLKEGSAIPAGAVPLDGSIVMRISQKSSESTLSRLVQFIHQAQEAQPKLQRWVDHLMNRYAIGVLIITVLVAVVSPFVYTLPFLGREGSFYRAIAFMIAASPCALILAIPIAYLSAMSACAQRGILVKGGIALDALTRCRILALDKTGTLTQGSLDCLDTDLSEEALSVAYALEQQVQHPIAESLCRIAQERYCMPVSIEQVQLHPGCGVEAQWQGKRVAIGRPEWLLPTFPPALQESWRAQLHQYQQEGLALAFLVIGSTGRLLRFQDTLREGVQVALHQLKVRHGMEMVMLTGDHLSNAQRIAKQLEIQTVYADLTPEEKFKKIDSLMGSKQGLAMVGDGINDGPALARATIGIAMGGTGTALAGQVAGIILMQDRFAQLDFLFYKAHQTRRILMQNVLLAGGAILLAILPALAGWLPLWAAVCLHEGGTVLVGLNALRLLKKRMPTYGNRELHQR